MASTDFSLFAYEEAEHKKENAPNALRTISEAEEMLDGPQHVLRFWETKFTQIKPLKRNGGRRFYRPQDIDILQQIKHLLYNQGYTIKGAKKAVDDFIQAKNERPVDSESWIATIPPASVNDNFVATAADEPAMPDLLAELAEAIIEPNDAPLLSLVANNPVVPTEELRAMRDELAELRDELWMNLPAASVAIQ